MEKAGKILMVAGAVLLCTCVTDYESVAPPTELTLSIANESGTLLSGADVYIYEDLTAFNQTIDSGTPAGFVNTTKSTNGNAQLGQLKSDISYYLYVLYKDPTVFPGTYVTYDNSEEKFSLKNKLTPGSLSSVRITLKPTDGFITYWTANANTNILPIDIFHGTTAKGILTQSLTAQPALFQTGALTLRTKKGNITFEGKSAAGCLWASTVTLAGSQSIFYQLEDCSVGTIAFYSDNTNNSKLPITLKLNANDVLPNITAAVGLIPADCSANNLVQAVRIPGNYTYEAVSTAGNCIWTGSFSLGANECKLIPLSTCP
jgi:hypothetical protein